MLLRGGQLQQGLDLRRRKRRRGPLLLHTSSRRCLPSQAVPLTLSPFLRALAIVFPVKLFLPEMEFQRQIYSPGLSTRYSWRMVFKSEFESPKFDAIREFPQPGYSWGKDFQTGIQASTIIPSCIRPCNSSNNREARRVLMVDFQTIPQPLHFLGH